MKPLFALFALFVVHAAFAADDLVPAQECRPRAGLPNFLAKANTPGAAVKIGYLGGSITAQNGWRPKTLAHFQKTWPQAKFSEINAASDAEKNAEKQNRTRSATTSVGTGTIEKVIITWVIPIDNPEACH